MSFWSDLEAEPWRFDLFTVLRELEAANAGKPRIGDSATRRDEYVTMEQDPFLEFPASTLTRATRRDGEPLKLDVRFLGLFGPQGALPLATTEEAYDWLFRRDDAFSRFANLFSQRFLQLFYRAWADVRPIAQHDRPDADRYITYLGALLGVGTAPFQDVDSLSTSAKLGFVGLLAPKAKSASRLRGFLAGLFDVEVEIDEFVGSWLAFEPDDRSRLGQVQSGLGQDCIMGASLYSIQDKMRIRVYASSLDQYRRFLPVGDLAEQVADAVFLYLGDEVDWDLELALAAGQVEPVRLGTGARLGWTAWMTPNWSDQDLVWRTDSRFHLSERLAGRSRRRQTVRTN